MVAASIALAAGSTGIGARWPSRPPSEAGPSVGRIWEATWARLDLAECLGRLEPLRRFRWPWRSRRGPTASRLDSRPLAARADVLQRNCPRPVSGRRAVATVDRPRVRGRAARHRGADQRRDRQELLGIAPKTASSHVEHILAKLGASRRAEIAAWATSVVPSDAPSAERGAPVRSRCAGRDHGRGATPASSRTIATRAVTRSDGTIDRDTTAPDRGRPRVGRRPGRTRPMTQTAPPTADRPHRAAKRYIYAWGGGQAEGDATMRDLLGGKGAGLAEMTNAGLPVPPGFTITTEACNDYFTAGEQLPDGPVGRRPGGCPRGRGPDRQGLRQRRRPAPRVGPLGRQVLHARDDGHGPQPRARTRRRSTAWSR